ncbi:MAG TPA: Uma2 family endonuclease, partial [Tepidisphaeraceae bacterium]
MTIQANTTHSPATGRTKVSYEEFLRDRRDEHAEWVDGEVIAMAPVSSQHQFVSLFLVRLLSEFVEHHQLGSVFFE